MMYRLYVGPVLRWRPRGKRVDGYAKTFTFSNFLDAEQAARAAAQTRDFCEETFSVDIILTYKGEKGVEKVDFF